jgi:hypothetical protein
MGEYVIRCSDDLVEALRARKESLGLSNVEVEAQLSLADGVADKYLGPSRTKSLCASMLPDLLRLLGVELVVRVNPEADARLQGRIERRDEAQVRPQTRLSRKLTEIATKQFYSRLSKVGNEARKAMLPPEARSRIARAAAISRWRQHRAAARAASASEARA